MPNMAYMPNRIFQCHTALNKAKLLEFGIKMPTWQLWCCSVNQRERHLVRFGNKIAD